MPLLKNLIKNKKIRFITPLLILIIYNFIDQRLIDEICDLVITYKDPSDIDKFEYTLYFVIENFYLLCFNLLLLNISLYYYIHDYSLYRELIYKIKKEKEYDIEFDLRKSLLANSIMCITIISSLEIIASLQENFDVNTYLYIISIVFYSFSVYFFEVKALLKLENNSIIPYTRKFHNIIYIYSIYICFTNIIFVALLSTVLQFNLASIFFIFKFGFNICLGAILIINFVMDLFIIISFNIFFIIRNLLKSILTLFKKS